ncbi:hypothetical protein ANN_15091 [Periplaneta americana]|uniref:Uncharacterized protein n=1 Tax=Periplaneta americana TaxID=6978 RepID=A0ABQ8SY46_PERAM|nr:hypothetical protein ANN_15091 [Periplaneta americana]
MLSRCQTLGYSPGGARRRERSWLSWLQDVENDLRKIGVTRWRRLAQDRMTTKTGGSLGPRWAVVPVRNE